MTRKFGSVEVKIVLQQIRTRGTTSEGRRHAIARAEAIIDAAGAALHALEELQLLVQDFIPSVGRCALQNYGRLNTAPARAEDAIHKLRALL